MSKQRYYLNELPKYLKNGLGRLKLSDLCPEDQLFVNELLKRWENTNNPDKKVELSAAYIQGAVDLYEYLWARVYFFYAPKKE